MLAACGKTGIVLILVLVDVGLGRCSVCIRGASSPGLNPCFSGCWSRTQRCPAEDCSEQVLILVLVDVGLGPAAHEIFIARS